MTAVAQKIRGLMKDKGWSMNYTAKMANLPATTVKSIIYGLSKNQKRETLSKLANAFQCSVDDLTGNAQINNDNLASTNSGNTEIIFDCIHKVEDYLEKQHIDLEKKEVINIVERISSLAAAKEKNNQKLEIDDTLIEWVIKN